MTPSVTRPFSFLKLYRAVALSLAGLALAGCAIQHTAKNPLKDSVAVDEGTVIVSVTVNTGEVSQFNRIKVVPVDNASKPVTNEYVLWNAVPGLSRDTALFIGVLPAGEYKLQTLFADSVNKFLAINDKQAAIIGTFKVQPKATVDLGRMVLTAANFKVVLGRSVLIPDNNKLVADMTPEYLRLMTPVPASGWTAPKQGNDVAEAFALIHPQGAGGFTEAPDGSVWGGTRMGTVVRRGTDGKWNIVSRTGQLDAILWVVPYAENGSQAVAVGEMNTFIRIDKDGKSQPVNPGNLPKGSLIFVYHSADNKQWFVGVKTLKSADLYTSDSLENGNWTRLMGDSIEPSFWSGGRSVWMWARANIVGFASAKADAVNCYDVTTRQWNSNTSPNKRTMTALTIGALNSVGVVTSSAGFGGVFAKTHYSLDCGATWSETNSPYKVKIAPPLITADGTILEGGGVFSDRGLYASKDNGATWSKVSDKVSFSESIWSFPTAGLLGVSRDLGFENIQHSSGDGTTWQIEVTSYDRRLAN